MFLKIMITFLFQSQVLIFFKEADKIILKNWIFLVCVTSLVGGVIFFFVVTILTYMI